MREEKKGRASARLHLLSVQGQRGHMESVVQPYVQTYLPECCLQPSKTGRVVLHSLLVAGGIYTLRSDPRGDYLYSCPCAGIIVGRVVSNQRREWQRTGSVAPLQSELYLRSFFPLSPPSLSAPFPGPILSVFPDTFPRCGKVQKCQKSRRIGCVIPHCKLQRGIMQPILRPF